MSAWVRSVGGFGCAVVAAACGEVRTSDSEPPPDVDSDVVELTDDDSIAGALPMDFDVEAQRARAEGVIDTPGDRDFYRLALLVGDVASVRVDAGGEGRPDAVVRVYDGAGVLIAENDDLPYRLAGTDAGLVFRAAQAGEFSFEVLEYGDWTGSGAQGDPAWTYSIEVARLYPSEFNEDAYSDNESIAQAVANLDDPQAGWWSRDPFGGNYLYANAGFGAAGDVDCYGLRVDIEQLAAGHVVVEFGIPAGLNTLATPVFELLDSSGRLLAASDAPWIGSGVVAFTYDVGVAYVVTSPGDYVLRVTERDGFSGPDAWYALMASVYTFDASPVMTVHAADEADLLVDAWPLSLLPSASVSGFDYAYFAGVLSEGDAADAFAVDADSGGRYLHFSVGTDALGSALDATVRVFDATGVERASADSDPLRPEYANDPAVYDVELPADLGRPWYLVIDGVDVGTGAERFYLGELFVSDEPLYEELRARRSGP